MAGIDKRIIVRLEAEDSGLVVGVRTAAREIDKLSKSMGTMMRGNPSKNLSSAFKFDFAKGYTDSIRKAEAEVKRLFNTLSQARTKNGAPLAYKQMAEAHKQVKEAYEQEKQAIKAAEERLSELIAKEKQYQIVVDAATESLKRRSKASQADRDKARAARNETAPKLKSVQQEKAQVSSFLDKNQGRTQELDLLISKNRQLAEGYNRVANASDTVNQAFNNELATIRRLGQLEQQRMQATDQRVTKARVAAEEAKRAQDIEVQAQQKALEMQRQQAQFKAAPFSQKSAAFLQTFAAAAAKASTVFGAVVLGLNAITRNADAMQGATAGATGKLGAMAAVAGGLGQLLMRGGQESVQLNQKLMRVAAVAGIAAVGLSRFAGMMKNVAITAGKLSLALANLALKGARALVGAFMAAGQAAVGFGQKLAGMLGNLMRSIGQHARARQELQAYRREMGQTVDAEGWHSRSLRGLVGNVVNMNRWINTLGASVRQLGQAFQNAGTTLSIFVSYPTSRLLGGMWQAATEFDSALIEVRKNADVLLESTDPLIYDLQDIKQELMDIAAQSPTPLGDLGKMAADAARLGLDPRLIAPFTGVMDQLVVATNLGADEAVTSIGRIMNMFYDLSSDGMQDVNSFMEAVQGLGSAINELGQANPVGESEIVSALLRLSPAASAIGMELPDAAAFAASVSAASANASRAGTQMNTALTNLARNIEKVAKAGGVQIDIMENLVSTDPTETFLSIADAIAQIDNPVVRTNAAFELFGAIGGKAVNIVGTAFEKTAENVALSREAFKDGQSLAREFGRAMDAVSNQVALLKNQFNLLGVTLGEAFLPVITSLLAYAIPIVQAVTKIFAGMDDRIKLAIVGLGLFAAAIGPVLYAMGSLLFSVGIMTTGLTGMITVFGGILKIPLALGTALLGLLAPLGIIKLAIFGAVGALVFFGQNITMVGSVISDFASNMFSWGYNMFMSFADGIYSAAETVIQAVFDTLSAIAAMLRSFSPPKEGPLKNIDKWGANIATTFASAFKLADLSGVVTFGKMINSTIEQTIRGLDLTGVQLFEDLVGPLESIINTIGGNMPDALNALVNFLAVTQSGLGDIGKNFENLGSMLGAFAPDYLELVKLQVKYNLAVEEGVKIQDELDNITKDTNDKVKTIASNRTMTVGQRVAAIRRTRASSARRQEQLEMQKDANKAEQDRLKGLLDYRKSLMDIFKKFLEANKSSGGGGGGGGGSTAAPKVPKPDDDVTGLDFKDVGPKLEEAQKDIAEKLAKMSQDAGRFIGKMSDAKQSILGFIDGITGKDLPLAPWGAWANDDNYSQAWEQGKSWRDSLLQFLENLQGWIQPMKDFASAAAAALYIFGLGASGQQSVNAFGPDTEQMQNAKTALGDMLPIVLQMGNAFKGGSEALQQYIGWLAQLFTANEEGVTPLQMITDNIKAFFGAIQQGFSEDNPFMSDWQLLLAPIQSVIDSVVILAGAIIQNLPTIGWVIGEIGKFALQATGYVGVFLEMLKSLAGFGDAENLKRNLDLTGNDWLKDIFGSILDGDDGGGKNFVQQLIDMVVTWIEEADFTEIGATLSEKIMTALFGGGPTELGPQPDGGFGGFQLGGKQGGGLLGGLSLPDLSSGVGGMVDFLGGFFSNIEIPEPLQAVGDFLGGILDGLNNPVALAMIGTSLAKMIADAIDAIPAESLVGAAAAIISGIVIGLKAGIEDESLKSGLSDIASALVGGIAGLPWTEAVEGLKELIIVIVDALAGAPWGSIGSSLGALLNALIDALADESLWKGVGELLGDIAGAIAAGILLADWGELFSADNLMGVAAAFLSGFAGALTATMQGAGIGNAPPMDSPEYAELQAAAADRGETLSTTPLGGIAYTPGVRWPPGPDGDRTGVPISQYNPATSWLDTFFRPGRNTKGAPEDWTPQAEVPGKIIQPGSPLGSLDVPRALDQGIRAIGQPLVDLFLGGFIPKSAEAADTGEQSRAVYGPPTAEQAGYQVAAAAGTSPATTATAAAPPDVSGMMTALITSIAEWTTGNIEVFNATGGIVAANLLNGVSLGFTTVGGPYFDGFYTGFTTWITNNLDTLKQRGKDIAQHMRTGISERFTEDVNYFNAIESAFTTYVSGVGPEHAIVTNAKSLGGKIAEAIGQGVIDNYKDILDGIEEAVRRAIASVSVSTSTGGAGGEGGTGNTGNNAHGTSNWRGGWTWVGEQGRELLWLPGGSRIMSNDDSYDMLMGAAGVGGSLSVSSAGYPETSEYGGQNISIVISGDVVVDSDKRIDQLADKISVKLAKRYRLAAATR